MRAQIFTARVPQICRSRLVLSAVLGHPLRGRRGFGESKAGDGSNVCKPAAIVPLVARD